jgi:hypothetical protein
MPVKLELEKHEVTTILEALATRPHNEVAALIHKIVHQDAQQKIEGGRTP